MTKPLWIDELCCSRKELDGWLSAHRAAGREISEESFNVTQPTPEMADDQFEYIEGTCFLAPVGDAFDQRFVIDQRRYVIVDRLLALGDELDESDKAAGLFVVSTFADARLERFVCCRAEVH